MCFQKIRKGKYSTPEIPAMVSRKENKLMESKSSHDTSTDENLHKITTEEFLVEAVEKFLRKKKKSDTMENKNENTEERYYTVLPNIFV